MKYWRYVPLSLFIVMGIILWRGLSLHPAEIPSPLIDQAAPAFHLPELLQAKDISEKDFRGKITLVNVWATWCYACAIEHPFLLTLAHEPGIQILGLNYKDDPTEARLWLKQHGNPYHHIAVDHEGQTAIDWGVYGTPETFLVDQNGIIRYKHIGPLNPTVWAEELLPRIQQLRHTT